MYLEVKIKYDDVEDLGEATGIVEELSGDADMKEAVFHTTQLPNN